MLQATDGEAVAGFVDMKAKALVDAVETDEVEANEVRGGS